MSSRSPTVDMSKVKYERPLSAECLNYLDDSSRRLKKSFNGFPADGAGLLNGSRWHGRQQPSKSRVPGQPADNKEAPLVPRSGMANRKYAETDVLMVRPSTAPDGTALRLTKRMVMTEHGSFDSSLGGGAVHVLKEEPSLRPSRGKGASSPDMTVRRTRRHVVPAITREHSADPSSKGLRAYVPAVLPGATGTLLAHHAFKAAADDCKLETTRAPNPVCETIDAGAARDMFYNRFDSYCLNKTKAIYGGRLRMG